MLASDKTLLSASDLKRLLRTSDGELIGEIIKLNKTSKYHNSLDVIRICSLLRKRGSKEKLNKV